MRNFERPYAARSRKLYTRLFKKGPQTRSEPIPIVPERRLQLPPTRPSLFSLGTLRIAKPISGREVLVILADVLSSQRPKVVVRDFLQPPYSRSRRSGISPSRAVMAKVWRNLWGWRSGIPALFPRRFNISDIHVASIGLPASDSHNSLGP